MPEWSGGPGGPKCGHADATEDRAINADSEKVDMTITRKASQKKDDKQNKEHNPTFLYFFPSPQTQEPMGETIQPVSVTAAVQETATFH